MESRKLSTMLFIRRFHVSDDNNWNKYNEEHGIYPYHIITFFTPTVAHHPPQPRYGGTCNPRPSTTLLEALSPGGFNLMPQSP
jgi:hypothetical protein